MRTSTVTAGVAAALVLAASPLLSGGAIAGDPFFADEGAPYNDRPYAEEYVYETYERTSRPQYRSYKDDPVDVKGAIKDGYPVPMPPPAYGEAAPPLPPKRVDRFACLESWQIEERLRDDGWTDIDARSTRRGVTRMNARRDDTGRPFTLRVDRCSGDLISARPSYKVFGEHRPPYRDHRWVRDY
ncbi:MAG TPA: hypothetical protein PK857_03680 [Hyphomicrobium sp.]|nr:hypothetical protein [Hyphomicrobium sp.]